MEKIVTISTNPYPAHEEGIALAVHSGVLFRNNPELEELYKQGYRVDTYTASSDEDRTTSTQPGTINVHLVK